MCLVSLFLVSSWVIKLKYSWWNYFLNNFSLFIDLTRLYLIIDNTISECIYFLKRLILKIYFVNGVSISFLLCVPALFFFIRLFYLSISSLLTLNLSTSLLLVDGIITYQTWFLSLLSALNLLSSASMELPSFQLFLIFFRFCEYWLTLHYENHWSCLLHKIHEKKELETRNTGIASEWGVGSHVVLKLMKIIGINCLVKYITCITCLLVLFIGN